MAERPDVAVATTNQRFRVYLDDIEVPVATLHGLVALRHTLAPDEPAPTARIRRA
jgi:hypothetical protein